VIIPPHVTAVPSDDAAHCPTQRWQKETNYGKRALVETTMGRYKAIIGPGLRARDLPRQQTEAAIAIAVLNRMLDAGRPNSVRSSQRAA
jgi:hypothetical protein